MLVSLARRNPYFSGILSAMKTHIWKDINKTGRNPYFSGILSAIKMIITQIKSVMKSRNPYFSGILSAISNYNFKDIINNTVAILILVESFLQ